MEENITLPCELDGQTVDKKRLDKLIDELGLNGRKRIFRKNSPADSSSAYPSGGH